MFWVRDYRTSGLTHTANCVILQLAGRGKVHNTTFVFCTLHKILLIQSNEGE
jgi:hypothetical protein